MGGNVGGSIAPVGGIMGKPLTFAVIQGLLGPLAQAGPRCNVYRLPGQYYACPINSLPSNSNPS